ncbi:MAG TPA: AmmeMemoRadiSam system protein A [Thermoanaerobaculia bacterium]|nr:AmmeMemoRadiSam system protein A [Thermoanaerobaculia bacterium]
MVERHGLIGDHSALSDHEKRLLLSFARRSIEYRLDGRDLIFDPAGIPESLLRPWGAFVTVRIDESLRGCIGTIVPDTPLYETVAENAVSAAFRDPRFPPLTRAELPQTVLEISVLGPIEQLDDLEALVIGRDGLIVRDGERAGLLLPQVATELAWDRDTFLSHACLKAGLPADRWRNRGCRIEKFPALVFSESDSKQIT